MSAEVLAEHGEILDLVERLSGEKSRIDNDAKTLCHKKEFAEKRLNTLNEKRKYLKS
ncbi:hypothetical protein FOIG_11278 [Fusarium odoratissimum NRRL 54006]|uniref:Uncharacterized protein n=1 Tax=Fusarium odoratissimum (strain NRRL 54006) TaxID=1089451 RepID=X0JIX6_FUSO5|nr:uncharacterized protein FOIG_11278 [Fusarium odoratissimum NRRL 54006]EXL96316.1 hypothetical protein FOIG_11278 [Fusarium odoratissimum NRRL 54006]